MVPALPPARRAFTDAALRPLGAPVVQRSTNTVVTGMTGAASAPPSPPTAKKGAPPVALPEARRPSAAVVSVVCGRAAVVPAAREAIRTVRPARHGQREADAWKKPGIPNKAHS